MRRREGHINLFFSRSTSSISHAWRSIFRKPVGFHSWGHYPHANLGGEIGPCIPKLRLEEQMHMHTDQQLGTMRIKNPILLFPSKCQYFHFYHCAGLNQMPKYQNCPLTRNSSLNCVSRAVLHPPFFCRMLSKPPNMFYIITLVCVEVTKENFQIYGDKYAPRNCRSM